jgi:hypothetical protein
MLRRRHVIKGTKGASFFGHLIQRKKGFPNTARLCRIHKLGFKIVRESMAHKLGICCIDLYDIDLYDIASLYKMRSKSPANLDFR